jgi:hypothetical protein
MRDPEFQTAYEDADFEIRMLEVAGPYVLAPNSGTCVKAETINLIPAILVNAPDRPNTGVYEYSVA